MTARQGNDHRGRVLVLSLPRCSSMAFAANPWTTATSSRCRGSPQASRSQRARVQRRRPGTHVMVAYVVREPFRPHVHAVAQLKRTVWTLAQPARREPHARPRHEPAIEVVGNHLPLVSVPHRIDEPTGRRPALGSLTSPVPDQQGTGPLPPGMKHRNSPLSISIVLPDPLAPMSVVGAITRTPISSARS